MGWCPECAEEGENPEHTRTVDEGLCSRHKQRRYRATEAGREATARYSRSEKGLASAKKWRQSEKGRAYAHRSNAKQRDLLYRIFEEGRKNKTPEGEA